jgi:Galactose oxidase, central domain/Kelch motif
MPKRDRQTIGSVVTLSAIVLTALHLGADQFVAISSMQTTRSDHTSTRLLDGRVLVTGGCDNQVGNNGHVSAEVFNPATNTFAATGSMSVPRCEHTETLLCDGRVLIAGSGLAGVPAEIYNPGSGSFVTTGQMTVSRNQHTSTLLPDCRVLIAGGQVVGAGYAEIAETGEIFDPSTGQFTSAGPMTVRRTLHTATKLLDGRVLITGGLVVSALPTRVSLATAEVFDPATGSFVSVGSMSGARADHRAVLLSDGRVLVMGGTSLNPGGAVATAEVFDPATGAFSPTGGLSQARYDFTATRLYDGTVLVAGGQTDNFGQAVTTAEVYHPSTGSFSLATPMLASRRAHAAELLSDGNVLISGGVGDGVYRGSAERYTGPAPNLPPTAVAGANQTVRLGIPVQLNGTASFDDNTPTSLLQFNWTLSSRPATSAATLSDAATASPTLVADIPGTYVARLVVTDQGLLLSAPSFVTVSDNSPPTAQAGPDQLVIVNQIAILTAAAEDAEGDPLSYAWTLMSAPAGSASALSTPGALLTSFTPDLPGQYVFQFVPSDFLGPGSHDTLQLTATTATGFAEVQAQSAATLVLALPPSAVTNQGNQNALIQFLANAVLDLQDGDINGARQKLTMAIARTDGCVLRGQPDGNGGGRDWVNTCAAQADIYPLLQAALDALP